MAIDVAKPFIWFYNEFGLKSIRTTGRNAYLIILARACRMFANGATGLVLALFFAELHFSDTRIGTFMTLTMLGDVILGTWLTLIADRVGRRKVLLGGSVLMVITGALFALFENYWLLLFAAVVGVVSATGGDFGPFRSVEESILSQLTDLSTRSDVLSWYVTLSTWGAALGSEAGGRLFESLLGGGLSATNAYHTIFWIYAITGIVNAALVLLLTKNCEAGQDQQAYTKVPNGNDAEDEIELDEHDPQSETQVNIVQGTDKPSSGKRASQWLTRSLSNISRPTLSVMWKLWILLAVDSLSDGMVPYSLTTYYLSDFDVSKSTLGDVTSIAYLLGAISSIFAGPLAKRIGLVNTMVFTHVPSSAAVLFFGFPNTFWLCAVLLFIRAGLNNMDQAPRSAFIAAVVKPEERTAVMGITSAIRTLAATVGPLITGMLAENGRFWIAFVIGGSLRLAYDLGLYVLFINMKIGQNEPDAAENVQQDVYRISDEEASEEDI